MEKYEVYVVEFEQKRLVATFEDMEDAKEYVAFISEKYKEETHKRWIIK